MASVKTTLSPAAVPKTSTTRRWRIVLYSFVAVLATIAYMIKFGGIAIVSPFVNLPFDPGPDIHRWHYTMIGAHIALLSAGCVLITLVRPTTKSGVLQFLLLNAVIASLGLTILDGPALGLIFLIPPIFLVTTYPRIRALLRLTREGAVSKLLLGLSLVLALALLPDIFNVLRLQALSHDIHAQQDHYFLVALTEIILVLGAVFSALKVPGWRPLGILTSLTLGYLGLAALLIPNQTNSWGVLPGIVALLGALVFNIAVVYEGRKTADNQI
jgi:hypothetical protein